MTIPPDTNLTFKADTIKHAAETNMVGAHFVSGAVTVKADMSGEVKQC